MFFSNDALSQLPELSFRSIVLPLVSRSVRFAHTNVNHSFVFKDGELVDGLGVRNWSLSYTIPFRQGIAKGPYRDLYIDTMPRFIDAFRDRSEGPLVDPVLGELQVRPGELSIDTDIMRRDGEDISVSFIHSPDPDDTDALSILAGVSGISSDAAVLDQVLAPVLTDFSLEDLLSSISNFKAQLANFGNQVTAQISNAQQHLEEFEETVTSPPDWPLRQASRVVRMGLQDLKEKATAPLREVIKLTTKGPQTIAAIASLTGMSVGDLLSLNPALASGGPMVPGGTSISYWGAG